MANEIGVVEAILGSVMVTSMDGSSRQLKVGDAVFAKELITTGSDGAIEIEFTDNEVMDLGRSSQVMLDGQFYAPSSPPTTEISHDIPTEQAVISLLTEGQGDDILSGHDDALYHTEPHSIAAVIHELRSSIELADLLGNPENQLIGLEHEGYLQIQVSNSEGLVQLIDMTSIAAADDVSAQLALNYLLSSGLFDDGMS